MELSVSNCLFPTATARNGKFNADVIYWSCS